MNRPVILVFSCFINGSLADTARVDSSNLTRRRSLKAVNEVSFHPVPNIRFPDVCS